MMGTLATALAGKKIRTSRDLYEADIAGDIEDVDGVLKITRIHVQYRLKAPEAKHDEVMEALEVYLSRCPAAQSVIGCIDITHDMTLENLKE